MELRDSFSAAWTTAPTEETLRSFSTRGFFRILATNLIPEKSIEADIKVGFVFPDLKEEWSVHVRKGVADVQPYLMVDLDVTAILPSQVWKEVLAKVRNPAKTFASSEVQIEGSSEVFGVFFGDVFS